MTEEVATAAPRWHLPVRVLDCLAAALVLLAGLVSDPEIPLDGPLQFTVRAASLVLLASLLPLRRRYPLRALTVAAVVAILAPLWTGFTSGYLLVLGFTVYRVAVDLRPRVAFVASGISAIALLLAVGIFGTPGPHYARLFEPVAVIGVALAVGQAVRNQRAAVKEITARAERAERTRVLEARRQVAEERLRIARELHDAAAHQIAAINLHAGVASNALPEHPEDAERSLAVIRGAARSVLDEISTLLRVLREEQDGTSPVEPPASIEGLAALIDDFARSGLQVDLDVQGSPASLGGAAGVVAYRTVQEGLANALKHGAGGAAVRILIQDDGAVVRVTNPMPTGAGRNALQSGKHGLLGIRERVDSVRGVMRAGRDDDRYVLQVELPLSRRPGW